MWSRRVRLQLLAMLVLGGVAGVLLEFALDPIEETHPGITVLGLLAGVLLVGTAGGYWVHRTVEALDGPDERIQAIELRASRRSQGLLVAGTAVLAGVLSIPWVDLPVATLLASLLVGSLLVHESSIEYYRRRM